MNVNMMFLLRQYDNDCLVRVDARGRSDVGSLLQLFKGTLELLFDFFSCKGKCPSHINSFVSIPIIYLIKRGLSIGFSNFLRKLFVTN